MNTRNLLSLVALAGFLAGCGVERTGAVAPRVPAGTSTANPEARQTGKQLLQFPAPLHGVQVGFNVVRGSDGNIWADSNLAGLYRITAGGIYKSFTAPRGFLPNMCLGPDGNIWGTSVSFGHIDAIWQLKMSGQIRTFSLPTSDAGVWGINVGPDGNLWFVETKLGKIGRITPTGTVTQFPTPIPSGGHAWGYIAPGPDGAMWFTYYESNTRTSMVGKITTGGVVTMYPLPANTDGVGGIVAGPDGNLWIAFGYSATIGKMTPSGSLTIYTAGAFPHIIIAGPDGALWFSGSSDSEVGRMTTTGKYTTVQISHSTMDGIAVGWDHNIWIGEAGGVAVYVWRVLTVTPSHVTFNAVGEKQTLTVAETHYGFKWTAQSSNPAVASVAPGTKADEFVVTSESVGTSTITIRDSSANFFPIDVMVQ